MSRRRTLIAALCGASAGLGLWATRASLDLAAGPAGPFRVAMLPSGLSLVALPAVTALLVVALLALVTRVRSSPTAIDPLDVVKPLAAAGLLVLPYLPWLADRVPLLLLLAGPGTYLWWGVLAAGMVYAVVSHRLIGSEPVALRPPQTAAGTSGEQAATRRRWTVGILLLGMLVSGGLAQRFIRTPLFPGGDEPHYLIIAQSLWRDGDLMIENNHARRDYDEYFQRDLAPHYLTRGTDNEIYSIHPVGVAALLAPVYAAGGYEACVWLLVLMGAAALTLAWRMAWAVTDSPAAATFAWAVLAGGVPWVFNTFAIYPEIPAALGVSAAFALTAGWRARQPLRRAATLSTARFLLAGLALATLPWLSTKYVAMALALGLVLLGRLWLPWPGTPSARQRALWGTAAVAVPCIISLAGWFSFFNRIWGTYSPSAPYGIQRETRLEYLPQGGPGLLFDQEYGIVLFAPALLMVLPGLWVLWQRGGGQRRLAVEIAAVWAGLLGVVGAFHIWWGGSAVVGRPVIAAVPLLIIPVAVQWAAAATQPARRAAQVLLLALGVSLTILMTVAQEGLLLVAGRDGASQVLEYLAPASNVWGLAPSFLRQAPDTAALMTLTWVVPVLLAGWILGRAARHAWTGPGQAVATVCLVAVLCASGVSLVVQATFEPSTPAVDLLRRPRVRLLDEFDDHRRPMALRYSPVGRLDTADVPGMFPIIVNEAGQRSTDRATKIFGQRLSLPAGRYGVDVVFPVAVEQDVEGTLGVRLGRTGPPYQLWPMNVRPPGSWGRGFSLPVDVGFVGLEVSPDIAAAGPQIRVTPQAIVPLSQRPAVEGVLGSGRYGDVLLLVHGADAWPERDGVWVRGQATAALTLVTATPRPVMLALRVGARPVDVEVRMGTVVKRAALAANGTTTISLPAFFEPQQIHVSTSDGFVPADVEPGSRDQRLLGCWIEIR